MTTVSTLGALVALAVAIVLILRKVPPAYGMIAGALAGGLCGGADLVQTVTLMIGGAQGITNAVAIAHASPRLIGIALGAEDYVRNLRTERSPEGIELLFARCSLLQAARAAGIQAFDTVYSDANNEAGFLQEAALIKQLGFDGKSLINPRQIELLHNLYAPTAKEVAHAQRVVDAAEAAEREGRGVVSLNGKMVDSPVIERARLVLERAALSGLREEPAQHGEEA